MSDREFAPPPDDVPVPPPTDPADDPAGTVRVDNWSRRLDPTARRWIRVAGADPWPWVQFSGIAWDQDRCSGEPWRTDDDMWAFPPVALLTVAVAFRHSAHSRDRPTALLDGGDAEGAAPFKTVRPEG